ncbi:MAG: hypothetical protein LBN71_08215 [Tannerella sp.]|jgi:hypothetical protein|nr:hypothetical protein [Tannerella sp.]
MESMKVSFYTIVLLLVVQMAHSQTPNEKDTIKPDYSSTNSLSLDKDKPQMGPQPEFRVTVPQETGTLSFDSISGNAKRDALTTLKSTPDFATPQFYRNNAWYYLNTPSFYLSPYSYVSDAKFNQLIIKGMTSRFTIGNIATADLSAYMSRSYFGVIQPDPYTNGSLRLDVTLNLHERVQLVGLGQLSVREGFDPRFPSSAGNANYYGAGIQFKVSEKFGFGFGVTNSYYRGGWTKQPFFYPAGF